MGITILSLRAMLPPLQRLAAWLAGAPACTQVATTPRSLGRGSSRACAAQVRQLRPRPGRALRVVRVPDSHPAARGAGRMVISGRMADVCAELDRLAALEAGAS